MDLELTSEEVALLAADDRRINRADWWILVIMAIFFAAAAIVAWHGIVWLRDGTWRQLPLRDALDWIGLDRPRLAWVGLQRIVGWILDLPLAFALFLLGAGTVWVAFGGGPDSEALLTARMKKSRKAAGRNS